MSATIATKPELPELHENAVAVSAFRALPDGDGRQYTVSEPVDSSDPKRVIRRSLRRAWAIGFVRPTTHEDGPCDCYAVLDILDANDDIVQDFCIPTARAFRWWYRLLGLRVVDVEAEVRKYYAAKD
ncbi:hypothetical protein [Nonomuraea wenchangensis]|uniref:Uncharacterized protein n=1 Tax=Nonomuraea wenchangensis TaxID=568860 RepID=A0A1I0EY05_9ACTN|nr:hypothetical protein [Nonomuraea wenchangensis]SET50400.1 hypothetical protein SAMN05421811_103250 [Nonomuraea wenchangensis]